MKQSGMCYEESVSYVNILDNLENVRCTKSLGLAILPVDNKKSVTSILGKSSKNHKGSNM
jgi:hypothetical protein